MEKVIVPVRMPVGVRDELRRVAAENHRTVSGEIRRLIARHLAPHVAEVTERPRSGNGTGG